MDAFGGKPKPEMNLSFPSAPHRAAAIISLSLLGPRAERGRNKSLNEERERGRMRTRREVVAAKERIEREGGGEWGETKARERRA
jgi:hypothetical protein